MPKYDGVNFDPPAPVAYVSLRDPVTGASLSNVPMLIDTGADVTLLPVSFVEQIGLKPVLDVSYEIQGFDGEPKLAKMVELELVFLGKKFSGQFLLIDQPIRLLGRNILNVLSITFDGPREKWDEHKRS
jgi:predicted aspartyl protease